MAEFVCTALFLFIIQLAATEMVAMAPLAIGFGLAALVYTCFPLSGGHINPAVTLAVLLRGKVSSQDAILYWIAQIVGGIIGALLGGVVAGKTVAPAVGDHHNFLQAWLAELIFTATLCYVVLGTATSSESKNNSFYGFSIGAVIFVGIVAAGPISGAAFNPAVVIGLSAIKNFWKLWKVGYALWIIVAEFLGGVLGAFLFYITAPDEFDHFAGENVRNLPGEARSLLPSNDH